MKKLPLFLLAIPAFATTIATFNFPAPVGYGGPQQEQIFEGALTTAYNPKTSHMVGPDSTTEVPYQALYQKIAFPAHFPATTPDTYFSTDCSTSDTNDSVFLDHQTYSFKVGTLLYYEASGSVIGGLTSGTTYKIVRYSYFYNPAVGGMDGAFSLALPGGSSPINITVDGTCPVGQKFTYTGFVVDGSNTFTSPNHGFQVGDPFRCLGTGSTGLTCDGTVQGYVIASGFTSSTFKISATVGGSAKSVATLTSGKNRIVPDFTYTLVDTGAPSATVTNPIVIDGSNASYWQMTNGLTGFRALKNGVSLTKNQLQGLQFKDGTWLGTGADLKQKGGGDDLSGNAFFMTATASLNSSFAGKFIEAGPLKVTWQGTYLGTHPDYTYNGTPITGGASGPGSYTVTLTMYANSKAVTKKIEGNLNYASVIEAYSAWPTAKPDYITSPTPHAPGCGNLGPLPITGATNANPTVLTVVNHGIQKPGVWSGTIAGVGGNTGANGSSRVATPIDLDHISVNVDTSAGMAYTSGGSYTATSSDFSSQTYAISKLIGYTQPVVPSNSCNADERFSVSSWYFYSQGGMNQWASKLGGTSTDPVLGIQTGHTSAQNYGDEIPVGFYSTDTPSLSVFDALVPCLNCGSVTPATYSGTNVREMVYYSGGSIADVTPPATNVPTQFQLDMNALVGINLSRLYLQQLNFADPGGGWTYPSMSDVSVNTIRSNYIANSPAGYTAAMNASAGASGLPTLNMWAADNSAGIDANIISPNNALAQSFLYALVSGFGTADVAYSGVQGTYFTGPASVSLSNALPDIRVTAGQITALKALAAFFGCTLWDYDFLPQDINIDSGATQNQKLQTVATRERYVSSFPTQPTLATHLPDQESMAIALINTGINAGGAGSSGPHYFDAVIFDSLFDVLALKKGFGFDVNNIPRLGRMTNWFTANATPPEPRYGTSRRCSSIADSVMEPCGLLGMTATAYAGVDTGISQQGIAAFFSQSTASKLAYSDFFGTNITAIDTTITNPGLNSQGNINYLNWGSFFRQNWGTVHEHWVAIRNGTFCSDHCHYDNGGIVQGYFHGSPWFMDPSANIYYPPMSGAVTHSSLIDDANFPASDWHSTITDMTLPVDYGTPAQTEFIAGTKFSKAVQTFTRPSGTVWTREVTLVNINSAYPIMRTWDHRAGGTESTDGATITWNQLASDATISAPTGSITAPVTIQPVCDGTATYPTGFTPDSVSSGLQHWAFTGLYWPTISNGINVDAYYLRGNSGDQSGFTNLRHPCGSTSQTDDYKAANTGNLTSFTQTGATTADVVMGSFRFLQGQTVDIAGVSGAGNPNATATVASVTGTTAHMAGFSSLSGSYTGGTAAPHFMESYQFWRLHGTGDFVTHHIPSLKTAAFSGTVTNPAGTTLRVVDGSETTNLSDIQLDWTNGTAKLLAAMGTGSTAAFNITLTGGTQEAYMTTSTAGVWTVTGMTAGTRCLDLSAFGGTWYLNTAATNPSINKFCIYHPGADPTTGQPAVYSITLTTTPNTAIPTRIVYGQPAGATSIRVALNGQYVAVGTCASSVCPVNALAAPGFTETHDYQ